MHWLWKKTAWRPVVLCALLGFLPVLGWPQQKYTGSDRELAEAMLKDIAKAVQDHYYDTKLHGVDWNARAQQAKKNVEAADSLNTAMSEIFGRPFIWSECNGMRDLNTLIRGNSGWLLNSATDINVWGQIVGMGTLNGQPHGFLLTPRNPFKP
jgi:Tricorn protease C1 domain